MTCAGSDLVVVLRDLVEVGLGHRRRSSESADSMSIASGRGSRRGALTLNVSTSADHPQAEHERLQRIAGHRRASHAGQVVHRDLDEAAPEATTSIKISAPAWLPPTVMLSAT